VAVGERLVCFADESGLLQVCSGICVAVVCFEKGSGEGLHRVARSLYMELLGALGAPGRRLKELKWRVLRKISRRHGVCVDQLVGMIRRGAVVAETECIHVEDVEEAKIEAAYTALLAAVKDLSLRGRRITVVFDVNLVPVKNSIVGGLRKAIGRNIIETITFRDSRKIPGIQLADILAGHAYEQWRRGRKACSS